MGQLSLSRAVRALALTVCAATGAAAAQAGEFNGADKFWPETSGYAAPERGIIVPPSIALKRLEGF